ncbi:MAG: amidohydrolase family protein [Xanthomonadales bacterium]|nr:amidohydrolase family protein [Xanthomonadales bacterium]
MNTLKGLLIIGLAVLATPAFAADILIRNANVHSMGSDGVLERADVLVRDGEIRRIGQNLNTSGSDASVIDAEGRPLTPGLFAGLTSIGLGEVSAVDESVDNALESIEISPMRPEFDVTPAYNPHSSLVPVTRIEGHSFTLLSASPSSSLFGGQGRMVALDGDYDAFFGQPVLFINVGGSAASIAGGSRAGLWMLLQQAIDEANEAPADNETPLLTRRGRSVLASFADGGTVAFSVNRASDILQVLKHAEKFGFRPVISGGAEAWMVAAELAEADVPVLLNPLQNLPSNFDALGSRLDNAALLHAAGVTIAFSGAGSHNARKLRQMAGNAVTNGLPHNAALAALTRNPAEIFGVADRQGSIEKGMPANLVLWSGDPLEVTTLADMVVINGQNITMTSRQTELRDRYLPEDPEMPRAYIKP